MVCLTLKYRLQYNCYYRITAHSIITRKINTQTKSSTRLLLPNHLPSRTVLCSGLESTQFKPDCTFRNISLLVDVS